ncbi:alpha-2-macroglobulin family protein [Olleya namhaensis]|uniref:alpha-2-macroglobulin family protein n=1 Tax=Olleya namhaensis TaxID=1144750 RepID=UPI0024934CB0|nr:MG2 domain-containing protein [Olleya namhaensis]
MKHISTFLMILLFATSHSQTNNYSKLWNQVEAHEINGLPKTALEALKTIETKAIAENNTDQRIKVLLFKSKFALLLEEDAQLSIINSFKAEIAKSQAPTKNVLENMLATLYWQYFKQNRYQFYRRTKTEVKADAIDFRTWDLETLFTEIKTHFDNSLHNGLILQQTDISQFEAIITKGKDTKIYRPTLFDFLSHNAIEFYKTSENRIAQPAYKFTIDNASYLNASEAFSKINITSKDSTSLQLQALKVYQDLIKFHLKDITPYALTDINTERLDFVYYHSTFNNKDAIYLKALQAEAEKHKGHEVSALYNFKIATYYNTQGHSFNKDTNPDVRFKIKDAYDICKQVIADFPESKGASLCKTLQSQIEQPNLTITAEQFVPIKTHARFLIRYTNVAQLTFNAHLISKKQRDAFSKLYKEDEKKAFIDKLKVEKTWTSSLKNENDYQQHTTETLVPKLDNGLYLIVGQSTDLDTNFFATALTQVTNIAIVNFEDQNQEFYQVINRNNGQPLANATVAIDYIYRNEILSTTNSTTDSKGIITLSKTNTNKRNQIALTIKSKSDTAHFGNYYLNNYYKNRDNNDTNYRAFIFTDRSIYRPSQTVYFKAIALKNKVNTTNVIANQKLNVILYNTNGEKVSDLDLITNDFGSISGEFILPNDGLTGNYSIQINDNKIYGNTTISVEEYKRPKFETNFNPITETIKVNDSVTVKGEAIAFAGSKITDAKVVYRVVRNVQYPAWYRWYRPSYNSDAQEITHGETITDAEGNYDITFKAIPDEKVDKSGLPIFSYEVTADVTDINGETRSTSTIVKVGYHALTATIGITPVIDKSNKDNQITITTQNLNGQFVAAKGTLKIYKLQAPNTVLRPRPWVAPDYAGFTEDTFKDYFPHDAYTNEDNPEHWKKGDLILSETFDTEKSKTLDLKNTKKWLSGAYIIALETKDKFGQTVKDKAKTMLFSDKDNTLVDQQLITVTTDKTSYDIGDTVTLTLATAAKDITVTVSVERNYQIEQNYVIQLNQNKKTVSIPVDKNDLGGFGIHYSLAAFNSYKGGSMTINVPYPKTELEIETLTFRDKLQPGTDETWSFKIKGTKGEKIASEFLASMYDASLDQFKSHNWNYSSFTPRSYYASYRRNNGNSFGSTSFRVNRPYTYDTFNNSKSFDQFNWFGFTINNNRWVYNQYLNKLRIDRIVTSYDSAIKKGYVSGTVIDANGLPLPSATIQVKGTDTGTSTDFDGKYTIKVKKGDVLIFNYVGYSVIEKTVGSDNVINISLYQNNESLDKVVVAGYSNDSRMKASRPNASLVQTLEGQVAGLNITSNQADYEDDSTEINLRGVNSLNGESKPLFIVDGVALSEAEFRALNADQISSISVLKDASSTAIYGNRGANGVVIITTKNGEKEAFSDVKARTNLQETAFFFPQLATDTEGNVSFNFTTPEALTRWNLNLFAHDKQGNYAKKTLQTVTQKDLMVLPNAPRFLRQGDQIQISTKISNLNTKDLTGTAVLQLFDALTGKSIDSELANTLNQQSFSAKAKGNTQVTWTLSIPDNVSAVQYKILAKSGNFSDGEQNALPVLTNRMLVTETLPMWIRSNESRTFTLDKLKTNTSTTLKHHKLTLEMTSNPAWYAVQALPYLMEYPYECNEQTFSRFYANALASHIVNSNPRIKEVFSQWKNTDALLSNLEKNQELKSILIQETPWLRDAQSETEQKKRIALLFDLNKMNSELKRAKKKLRNNQMSNGGWSWFGDYRVNRYITQHIITGFGHLKKLNVISDKDEDITDMVENALDYLDAAFEKEYNDLTKYTNDVDYTKDHLSYTQLHYLYMRSFFPEYKLSKKQQDIHQYYLSQIRNYWLKRPLYAKGMMALIMNRNEDKTTSNAILKSVKENSITSDELGMYWKENTNSYYWYQASIETQALMIEAFAEIDLTSTDVKLSAIEVQAEQTKTIDNLKIWLLKNKQTNRWKTTKATTDAVYALLLQGNDWLSVTDMVDVVLGGEKITPATLEDVKVEAGTGYYKTSWSGADITPKMADVKLTKKGDGIAWGSLYWQYFEDLDKITSAETPLKLKKQLYLKTNTYTGEVITAITKDSKLKVGDLVRVRIELRSDRAMEFVHMKDMRAAGLEPVNVLSKYKYQDGLGYYEATKDASTNFFFDYLPKGIYVFEYDLRVNNAGNMSNGITTIQSMYAPEFSSHSEGVRIEVE